MKCEHWQYLYDLINVTMIVINNKEIYNEPWDMKDKKFLNLYIAKIILYLKEQDMSKLQAVIDELTLQLEKIVEEEYPIRIYYIGEDIKTVKENAKFASFDEACKMERKVNKLNELDPNNNVVEFLKLFNEVHDYYYYKGMVYDFKEGVLCCFSSALYKGEEQKAIELFNILFRFNQVGHPYADDNNLFFLTNEVNRILNQE